MRKNHHGKKDRLVKRVFALCLALAVICTCLVPVFATEYKEVVDSGEEEIAGFGGDEAAYPDDEVAGFGEEEATRPVDGGEAAGFGEEEATRPVEGGEDNLDGGPNVKETEWGTVIEYDTGTSTDTSSSTVTQWSGEDAVVDKSADEEVVSGDEIKKLQDMVVYRFWLRELNTLDLQDIATKAQNDNMTESEYLARNGEVLWNLYFIQAVPRAETIADYSSYIENPSSNRDPKGELRLFDYWYTLDEFGNRVRLNLTDPTSNILDDKTTTVNVYAAWKDGTVGSDEAEKVDHEDLVDKNPVPVDLTAKAAASYEDEEGELKTTTLPVEVKNLPSAADHLSVIHMGDDDMQTFYESHEDSFGEMMPILGLKISPKNAKGETVQPAKGEKATVTVSGLDKLPEIAAMEEVGALTADALKVLHQKDNNTVEKLDVVSYENGTLTFETSSFSPFVLALTGGYDVETLAWGQYENEPAAIFILKNPNGNPKDTNESSWGYAVMGAKVNGPKISGTYLLNLNDTTYTLTPPTGWETEDITYNGKIVKAWCLPNNVIGYNYLRFGGGTQNMWQQIFETYQNNITDVNGELIKDKTLTIDDIEKIYVIPYKLSQRILSYTSNSKVTIPGLHIDCQIVVQCKSTYSVNFHITDVGETDSTRVSAATYIISQNSKIRENNGLVNQDGYGFQYNNNIIYKYEKTTDNGIKYIFDGWYTDENFSPNSKVKKDDWPINVTKEEIESHNKVFDYYGRYIPVSADLTVTKTVTGMLGDTNKAFTFTVKPADNSKTLTITADDIVNKSDDVTFDPTNNTFTLTHGAYITLSLPVGSYVVEEAAVDNYTAKYKIGSEAEVESNSATVRLSDTNQTLAFTNHCGLKPDTGVLLDTLPYIVILAVVAGGVALLMLRKRRKEDD